MNLQQFFFSLILSVSFQTLCIHCIDYCAITCGNEHHIACENNGAFGSLCPKNAMIIDLTAEQDNILNKHNTLRDLVAGGKVTHLKPAVRMSTMRWDPELARLALLNVLRCKLQHDNCHNTAEFSNPGQNLAVDIWFDPKQDVGQIIQGQIQRWFNENILASKNDIESLGDNWQNIGHFTAMVNEKNTHIGCGCVEYVENNVFFLFTACNYAINNYLNRSIYEAGPKAALKCRSNTNPVYPNLCSIKEVYEINII